MKPRRLPLILAACLLPALLPAMSGCSGGQDGPPPPSAEAQAAIGDDGGASRLALARAIDSLFDEDAVGTTQALVVMKRGSVIAERYGPGIGDKTPLNGWSMAQCVTALMIGQLVSDGRLRMDETAPVPDWQRPGDPRGEITLRQLLQMRSGLRHSETAQPPRKSDRMRMLFLDGRDDMAAYAEAQPLEAPAGRRFEPSAATGVILADLAARVLTDSRDPAMRRRAVGDYLRTRVLDPVGMKATQVTFDRAGTLVGSSLMLAPARSWAMLGEFLRHTGSVKGAQVLPHRWVRFMRSASPRNPAYGAGVWLNGAPAQSASREPVSLWPGQARKDLFACRGEFGQYVIGSPDQLLTVVRLGHTAPEQDAALHDRLGDLVALFPG